MGSPLVLYHRPGHTLLLGLGPLSIAPLAPAPVVAVAAVAVDDLLHDVDLVRPHCLDLLHRVFVIGCLHISDEALHVEQQPPLVEAARRRLAMSEAMSEARARKQEGEVAQVEVGRLRRLARPSKVAR